MRSRMRSRTLFLLSALLLPAVAARAQDASYTALLAFTGSNGAAPTAPLIQGANGNYYGTTEYGGDNGGGTLFEMDPAGNLIFSYAFPGGLQPSAGPLYQGADGNLYGTTDGGGDLSGCGGAGCGLIYQFNPSTQTPTVLYNFSATDNDQAPPHYGMIQGTDGNFYGLSNGGLSTGIGTANGEAFQLIPDGTSSTFNVLYHFCQVASCTDGQSPVGNLVQGSDGNFYGTAQFGGANASGVAYEITSGTTPAYAKLFDFSFAPNGTLIEDSQGTYLGAALYGDSGNGEIYELTPNGANTTVSNAVSFSNTYGVNPNYPLFLGGDGNVYGATQVQGIAADCAGQGCGTAFQLASSTLTLSALYSFTQSGSDTGLLQGNDGNFYGTLSTAGTTGDGLVFQLKPTTSVLAPVQLNVTPQSGGLATLSWSVANAFSDTMQQCYAFVNGAVATSGGWSGLQTGTLSGGKFNGSATGVTYNAANSYSLTCGGTETAIASTGSIPTTAALSFNPNPVPGGSAVTIMISVSASQTVNEGSATVTCDGITLGPANITNGQGTITTSTGGVASGTYSCTAKYTDNAGTFASSSGSGTVVIGKQTSTVQLSSNSPIGVGTTAMITATVTGQVSTPAGSVTFSADGFSLGTVPLTNGVATLSEPTTSVPPGTYTVRAAYSGDTHTAASSSSIQFTITQAATTTMLTTSTQNAPVGTQVTLTAAVARTVGSGTPTGTVKFYADGMYLLASATLHSGVASYTASSTGAPPGTYNLTAVYQGDSSDASSTSNTVPVTLTPAASVAHLR